MDKQLTKLMKDFEDAHNHLVALNAEVYLHANAVHGLIKRLHNELLIMKEQEKNKS